jgi:tetratricopeptide (TPR) repeat protein
MNKGFSTVFEYIKHYSREIIIALVLAVVAAIGLDVFNSWSLQRRIDHDLKAVATIHAFENGKEISQGSGFFLNSHGLLATNFHVIKGASRILAKLSSGAFFELQSIRSIDEQADIAILQFDATETPAVMGLGNSDEIVIGDKVYTIGTPVGHEGTLSYGNISNPNQGGFIQFTAPISPGSSGGGLFAENGFVIGITSAAMNILSGEQAKAAQNLNLAVPINKLKNVIEGGQHIVHGSPDFYYALGSMADNKQKWDDAIENYKKAIELDDKYADAYYGLGGDYFQKGNFELELQNYEKAVQLAPDNADYQFYLANAYEDTGRYLEAIKGYKRVLSIDANHKEAMHDLALAYMAMGDKAAAAQLVPALKRLDNGWGSETEMILGRMR